MDQNQIFPATSCWQQAEVRFIWGFWIICQILKQRKSFQERKSNLFSSYPPRLRGKSWHKPWDWWTCKYWILFHRKILNYRLIWPYWVAAVVGGVVRGDEHHDDAGEIFIVMVGRQASQQHEGSATQHCSTAGPVFYSKHFGKIKKLQHSQPMVTLSVSKTHFWEILCICISMVNTTFIYF